MNCLLCVLLFLFIFMDYLIKETWLWISILKITYPGLRQPAKPGKNSIFCDTQGKPGKLSVFCDTQGKPGKLREF